MQNRQKLMIFEQENGQKPHFSPFLALIGPFLGQHIFFSKIRKRHFSRLISGYLDAKNQKKLMAGNMRTCVADRLTDRRTDRRGWIIKDSSES